MEQRRLQLIRRHLLTGRGAGAGRRLRLAGIEPHPLARLGPAAVTRTGPFLAVFGLLDGKSMAGGFIDAVSHPAFGAMRLIPSASARPGRMVDPFN